MAQKGEYNALEIIEGYGAGAGATGRERLEAWAYLIKTGKCFELRPYYGRTAKQYIADGIINEAGELLQPTASL